MLAKTFSSLFLDQVENLRELFPGVSVTQVESALRAVNGNIDEAASVIMLDNSTGLSTILLNRFISFTIVHVARKLFKSSLY